MKLLGNSLLGSIAAPTTPPYDAPYTPPYDYPEVYSQPAYRETGVYPLQRPPTSPLVPGPTPARYRVPAMPGPKYIQGPIGNIIPATHAPYPLPRIISDRTIVKILVSKNMYQALQRRGLPTMAMRRRWLDENTTRAIEEEVVAQTIVDMAAVANREYSKIGADINWQREAVRYKLLDAAELQNLMSRVVGIQTWLSKDRAAWPMELVRKV